LARTEDKEVSRRGAEIAEKKWKMVQKGRSEILSELYLSLLCDLCASA
jgi:hypothetical protein